MGGGEDARRRCHCQKTLTPPDEASVDASTHSTAQHTRTHHGQAHTRNTHRDLARTRAGSRATNRAPSTLHTRAAVQPCILSVGEVAHATHASMRGGAGENCVKTTPSPSATEPLGAGRAASMSRCWQPTPSRRPHSHRHRRRHAPCSSRRRRRLLRQRGGHRPMQPAQQPCSHCRLRGHPRQRRRRRAPRVAASASPTRRRQSGPRSAATPSAAGALRAACWPHASRVPCALTARAASRSC